MEIKMSKEKAFIFQQKEINYDTLNNIDEFYTIEGDHDYHDDNHNPRTIKDNKKTLAKKLFTENKKPRYLIKMNTAGKLHNPLSIVSQQKMTGNFLDRKCREPKFKSVSNKTFIMYINFLRTKNLSWLYNADREAE
jgi:hypothetical protein